MDYSPWFDFGESNKSSEKRIASERASQEEQSGETWIGTHDSSLEGAVKLIKFAPFYSF